MSDPRGERPRRANLAEYYASSGEKGQPQPSPVSTPRQDPPSERNPPIIDSNPLNINGPSFDADQFTQKLISEASLSQLMSQEAEVVRQIGALDSDMQTLVYENYNKFIAATDTIKKMRVDFRVMEDEMDQLASKMQNITAFSGQITDTLRERRARIGKLSGTHALLKKLQFLFELPSKLKECLAEDDLPTGVRYYLRAQRVLDQYEHMPSFKGIKGDCDQLMLELRERLMARLKDAETPSEDLTECVNLLLQLQEPAETLCELYLTTSKVKLDESLMVLDRQVKLASQNGNGEKKEDGSKPSDQFEAPMDILEFVDHGCNSFLSDLCLVIAAYNDTFLKKEKDMNGASSTVVVDEKMANEKLTSFVKTLINTFFAHLRAKLRCEKRLEDTALRVKALDRFHRRLQAMCRLLPTIDFSRAGLDLVLEAAELHCGLTLQHLKDGFAASLMDSRQALVAPRRLTADSDSELDLSELNNTLLSAMAEQIRDQLDSLQQFIDPELTFAVKTYFRAKYCRYLVREGVIVAFFSHVIEVAQNFCADTEKSTPPAFLLLLSRTCYDLQLNTVRYLLSTVDERFYIDDASSLTPVARVNAMVKTVSHMLLNAYMKAQGGVLSQMLRKSVETRDWLNTVEPRTVRAVMKRVVEETTVIDRQVGRLYEEGARKARSSDSSRRTRLSGRSRTTQGNWSVAANASLASNIQKMFSERIEIFSSVEFSRVSVLTGVVKVALKTLLECVRMRTFSRFGFQQQQVDAHYLHLYLWRFVSDEALVTHLLDEVMTSVVHRCPEPVPMEQSVIDVICDRG